MKQQELETVSKPNSRGTGVSPVREKILYSQHRRDACATMNFCRAAISLNCYHFLSISTTCQKNLIVGFSRSMRTNRCWQTLFRLYGGRAHPDNEFPFLYTVQEAGHGGYPQQIGRPSAYPGFSPQCASGPVIHK